MRMLLLKTWRDLLSRKGQFAGLIMVVALGISTFVAFQTGYLDLTNSVERANRELRFADFSTSVTGIPSTKISAVRAVPGVLAAEGRIVQDVSLELDEAANETATARIVGLPNSGRPAVNDLLLLSGDWPRRGDAEAILHTKFAQETGARAGDELTLLMGRDHKHVRVVGIAASPEYMYAVPEKGSLPSPREFAVLFMRADDAGRLTQALVAFIRAHPRHAQLSGAVHALYYSASPDTKGLLIDVLRDCLGRDSVALYQTLLALEALGENLYGPRSSTSCEEVERSERVAREYLASQPGGA